MVEFFEGIINSFSNLSTVEWIGQIAGILAFITLSISYQFDRRKHLLFSIIPYLCFLTESACSLLSPSVLNNVVAIIRNIIMVYYLDKYNKQMPNKILFLMLALVWIIDLTMFFITGRQGDWYNYIAPVVLTILSICYNFKNYYILKLGAFFMEFGMLVYYIVYMLPFSIIRQIILVTSLIISVIIMFVKDMKNKHKKIEENNLTN